MGEPQTDNLDIPDFLRRTDNKVSGKKEVVMGTASVETTRTTKKPIKGKAVTKPAKAVKAKAAVTADVFGFRTGSMKSKAAAMYSSKKGATLEEVKTSLGSVQLNLLKDLEQRGFKVKRVKEAGDGKRQVTRYFLSGK
jgi:hypothetical protein